jgi:hypothetical protein
LDAAQVSVASTSPDGQSSAFNVKEIEGSKMATQRKPQIRAAAGSASPQAPAPDSNPPSPAVPTPAAAFSHRAMARPEASTSSAPSVATPSAATASSVADSLPPDSSSLILGGGDEEATIIFTFYLDSSGTGIFTARDELNPTELDLDLDPGPPLLIFDLSSETLTSLPVRWRTKTEGKTEEIKQLKGSFRAPGGLVCAKFPGTVLHRKSSGTPLQMPYTDCLWEAAPGSVTRIPIGLRLSQASIEVTSCAYLAADYNDPGKDERSKRHKPLPGVTVRFSGGNDAGRTETYEVTTDEFSKVITDISPGAWSYEITGPKGYQLRPPLARTGTAVVTAASPYPLHICFLPSPAVVAGQIRYADGEENVSGQVLLEGFNSLGLQKHRTEVLQKDGSYRFKDVELGTYQLRVQKLLAGSTQVSTDLFLMQAQTVTVSQPGFIAVPDIQVRKEVIDDIEVALTDENGTVLAGEWVELWDRNGKIKLAEALSDAAGNVRFSPGMRGLYYLKLRNGEGPLQAVEVQAR